MEMYSNFAYESRIMVARTFTVLFLTIPEHLLAAQMNSHGKQVQWKGKAKPAIPIGVHTVIEAQW